MKIGEKRKRRKDISVSERSHLNRFRKSILEDITRIEPRLHRIILSGDYSYKDLNKKLGTLVPDKRFHRKKRMPLYRSRAWRTFKGMRLTIFYNPILGFLKPCRIEFTFSSPGSLMKLYKQLPELKITSVEYTVDIFCGNHDQVAALFYLLLHYMYFEYETKKMEPFGDTFLGYGDKRQENAGYHIGENAKLYERGPDNRRKKRTDEEGYVGVFWPHGEVDRVRVEFTFDRKHRGRGGLDVLKELVDHPKFTKKMYHLFQFRVFNRPGRLPRETEDYWYRDKNGKKIFTEIFQEVCIRANESGMKNMTQYLENADGFDELKAKLRVAMVEFDSQWVKKRKRFLKRYPGSFS